MFDEIMSMYTRKDALEDGVLIDISDQAKEHGFKLPVAITCAVNSELKNIPEEHNYQTYQGRLNDLLHMGYIICRNGGNSHTLLYSLIMHTLQKRDCREFIETYITLKIVIHGGDNKEPVITIMMPDED